MKDFITVEGCASRDNENGSYTVDAFGRVDSDGTGPHQDKSTAQNHTSYKPDLNASVDRYVVVPPQFRAKAKGVVMGCLVNVQNLSNGKRTLAIVGDSGPFDKWGEMSIACALALGLDPSPVSGGMDQRKIRYTYYPGVSGTVRGKPSRLQPA